MPTRAQIAKAEEHKGGHTELMRAALNGDLKAVTALAGGGDVNESDDEGRTALMFAAVNKHTDCAKALLEHDADVNARAKDGGTALMLAATSGDIETVRGLLRRGADVSTKFHKTGQTALAIAKQKGYEEIVQLLQAAGASE